ncbi:MAG: hypothetical protein U5K79_23195 [Cyclobacteriaceae bacterium]|nr:hypothetical protein [Cyclobacteriaceae bacterium]
MTTAMMGFWLTSLICDHERVGETLGGRILSAEEIGIRSQRIVRVSNDSGPWICDAILVVIQEREVPTCERRSNWCAVLGDGVDLSGASRASR